MNAWRSVVADTAHVLSTPLTAFEDMDWAEVLLWHEQARRLCGRSVTQPANDGSC